jgi:hypothetical protein
MSLAVVSKAEGLDISGLDGIFDGVEPLDEQGPDATRVVVGELKRGKLARIKRVATVVLGDELEHHDYFVNLAIPQYQFDELTLVLSSVWKVTPQAASQEEVVAEYKPGEVYALYHPKMQPELESPADIFDWYDDPKTKRQSVGGVPNDVSPNIYTVAGMEELIKYGKFKGIQSK